MNTKTENNEILAVITAALAAMNTRDVKLVVKSFKRVGQTSPIWNMTGRFEQIRR